MGTSVRWEIIGSILTHREKIKRGRQFTFTKFQLGCDFNLLEKAPNFADLLLRPKTGVEFVESARAIHPHIQAIKDNYRDVRDETSNTIQRLGGHAVLRVEAEHSEYAEDAVNFLNHAPTSGLVDFCILNRM
jgi:hypothetical protein